jgi:hypothetical protein
MAYLVLMDGPDKGQRYELPPDGEVTLGRADDNGIVVEGPAVSSHHCSIIVSRQGFALRDRGSTNGTRVNDEPVSEAQLYRGDVVSLGTTPIMIEGSDVPAREGDPAVSGGVERKRPDFRPRTTRSSAPVLRPKDFGKRRDHNRHWKVAILLIGLLVLVGLVYFVLQMML